MSSRITDQSDTDRRLKVLFITPWYPTTENPVNGVFVREHAKAVGLYDDVAVLHFAGHTPKLGDSYTVEEVTERSLTEGIPTYKFQYRTPAIQWIFHPVRYWSYLRAFQQLRKQGFRPDIIHANIHVVSLPAIFLGYIYRIPVVITEHNSAFPRRTVTKRRAWEARIAFKRACHVLPVSNALQKGIEEYGIQARFQIVPNVVDMKLFKPPQNSVTIGTRDCRLLCVATMPSDDIKGISYLLDALARLRNSTENWRFQIVGDGEARQMYEEQARRLHLLDKVEFLGRKSKAEVAEFMRESDVFVLPSLWDNMPCVLIEAMACGLPIVATQVGGIPEMVDEQSGILIPSKDVDALCTALAHMLSHYTHYDRRQIAATAQERYSQEAVGTVIHSIYQVCINESIY
jgi:glycosyltransferase involved in cell wall biosynthesis